MENVAITQFNPVLIFLGGFEGAGTNPEIKFFQKTFIK